jgi:hypothetical protein
MEYEVEADNKTILRISNMIKNQEKDNLSNFYVSNIRK